jgi:hypothetical protein
VRNGLRLPLYLDSIGAVPAGALAGPLIGALTGALSNVAWGIILGDAKIISYAITAACVGVAALLSVAALGGAVLFLLAFGSAVFAVFYVAVLLAAWIRLRPLPMPPPLQVLLSVGVVVAVAAGLAVVRQGEGDAFAASEP